MFVTEENNAISMKWPSLIAKNAKNLCFTKKKFGRIDSRGRIFSQAEKELGLSSFLSKSKVPNDFPFYLEHSWERTRFQTD